MKKVIKYLRLWFKKIVLFPACLLSKREYDTQTFIGINERPIEYQFVFKQLTRRWPKTVLDVGTGLTALPHLIRNCGFMVTATDNIRDYWPIGMVNRHFHVIHDDITRTRLNQTFDFIICVSVLEHIKDHEAGVKSMFSLLNRGGYLIFTFPYNENRYVENVYNLPGSGVKEKNPFITQVYSRSELNQWLTENHGKIVDQEYWRFFTGEFWTFGERVCPPLRVEKENLHQITCICIQKS